MIGVCTANAGGGTLSPCPKHCFAKHEVRPGDPCDPMLFRFTRRQYDDAQEVNKDWMGHISKGAKGILGKPFRDEDADFKYLGLCRYMCPRVLCMGVELGKGGEQFVDLIKWDCVSNHNLDQYVGICTCGYLWSMVDPLNQHHNQNDTSLLVGYSMTVGLNRRLAWDKRNERCGAQRYGHCSLEWPNPASLGDNHTYCLESEKFKCVNRTANFLGVAYRPIQVADNRPERPHGTRWYGICDSEILIEDPFSTGVVVYATGWMIAGFCLCILLLKSLGNF